MVGKDGGIEGSGERVQQSFYISSLEIPINAIMSIWHFMLFLLILKPALAGMDLYL